MRLITINRFTALVP